MKTEKYEVIREYFDNGKLMREIFKLKGYLHNSTGPAFRCWYSTGELNYEEYWLNGKQYSKEEFEKSKNDCVENKVVEIEGKKYKLVAV